MSYANFKNLLHVLDFNEKLNTTEFAVLIAIAKFSNKNNLAWPKREKIKAIARISERTYQRCIKSLQEKKLIKITTHKKYRTFDISQIIDKSKQLDLTK